MIKLRRCKPRVTNSYIPHRVEEADLQQANKVNMQKADKTTEKSLRSDSSPSGPKVTLITFFSKFICNNPVISGRYPGFFGVT